MADSIESVDELCIALEALLGRARQGDVPAWLIAGVLEDYEGDIRALGYVPPQWVPTED